MSQATDTGIQVRPFFPGDIPRAVEIEAVSHASPWSAESFRFVLDRAAGHAAVISGYLTGYLLYTVEDEGHVHIQNITVHPKCRRSGVAKALMRALGKAMRTTGRTTVMVDVRETCADAQAFFAAIGFKATSVINGFFLDTLEDSYRMVWTAEECKGK